MHPSRKSTEFLEKEIVYEATRSTGPGGQHRNRVATAIRATHKATKISAMATERRSQLENKTEALFRLRRKLAINYRSPITNEDLCSPALYQPSELWLKRLKGRKIKVSSTHIDFPAILAEVLDRLQVDNDEVKNTATAFRISTTQLIKFLAIDGHVLNALNERRKTKKLKPLKA